MDLHDDNLLGRYLSYRQLTRDEVDEAPRHAIDYIEGDPRLQPWAKDVLRNVYEAIADKVEEEHEQRRSHRRN